MEDFVAEKYYQVIEAEFTASNSLEGRLELLEKHLGPNRLEFFKNIFVLFLKNTHVASNHGANNFDLRLILEQTKTSAKEINLLKAWLNKEQNGRTPQNPEEIIAALSPYGFLGINIPQISIEWQIEENGKFSYYSPSDGITYYGQITFNQQREQMAVQISKNGLQEFMVPFSNIRIGKTLYYFDTETPIQFNDMGLVLD
jgi:hypothetical protein